MHELKSVHKGYRILQPWSNLASKLYCGHSVIWVIYHVMIDRMPLPSASSAVLSTVAVCSLEASGVFWWAY